MSATLAKNAEKLFTYLGHKTDPVIAVAIIAVCKAIFRPTFTLANKHQPKERKQYAALREFLTEMIALPSYIIMSNISKHDGLAKKLTNPGNLRHTKEVLSFIGICITAGLVIPALCNLAITPIMMIYKAHQQKKNNISNPAAFSLSFIPRENINYIKASMDTPTIRATTAIPKGNVWSHYNFNVTPGMRVGG